MTALAVTLAVLAVGVAVTAFTIFSPAAGVVLDPEPAALPTATSVPPTNPPSPEPAVPPSTTTTLAPEPKPWAPPAVLTINDLDISETVRPVGLEDSGAMEVPEVTEVGWYLHGAVPGHEGATVLVAHVWWDDTAGPFHRLGALEPGAPVEVRLGDDTVHQYTVVERAMYDKYALPGDLWRKTGPETLVLITCGGDFNNATRRYKENIVVYALPSELVPSGVASNAL